MFCGTEGGCRVGGPIEVCLWKTHQGAERELASPKCCQWAQRAAWEKGGYSHTYQKSAPIHANAYIHCVPTANDCLPYNHPLLIPLPRVSPQKEWVILSVYFKQISGYVLRGKSVILNSRTDWLCTALVGVWTQIPVYVPKFMFAILQIGSSHICVFFSVLARLIFLLQFSV